MSLSVRTVCREPFIQIVDDFLNDSEILHVSSLAADKDALQRNGIAAHFDQTGYSFEYPVSKDPLLREIGERIAGITGVRNKIANTFRYRHYMAGQGHPPHLDTYNIGGFTLVITAIVYLNDVAEGGETHFPHARPEPVSIECKRGRLAIWHGHKPDMAVDTSAYHAGSAVKCGNKFTITNFIYSDTPPPRAVDKVAQ